MDTIVIPMSHVVSIVICTSLATACLRQGKARPRKAREGKGRHGKRRQGEVREDKERQGEHDHDEQ
jgi:hypothetical protein